MQPLSSQPSQSSEVTLVGKHRDDAPPFQPQQQKPGAAQSEAPVQKATLS